MTGQTRSEVGIPSILGGLFLLNLLFLSPRWIVAGGIGAPGVAFEAFLLVGLLLLLPRRGWSRVGVAVLSIGIGILFLLALGDAAARMILARPLNLYLDVRLLGPVFDLMIGNIGFGRTLLGFGVATAGWITLTVLVGKLLARLPTSQPFGWHPRAVAGFGLCMLAGLGWVGDRIPDSIGQSLGGVSVRMARPVEDLLVEQARYLSRMLRERERFAEEMAASLPLDSSHPGFLQGLSGTDVVLAFLESYGMSALDDPRYAPWVVPRLEEMEIRLEAAGLHLATGALVAPIQGGQSWLGRGSVLSGLWLENQFRYELLLASDRETLVDDFRRAGYRTVALMPAITLAWPEGERLGYDRIYAHKDIDYRGPPLNWVTMPDQFTWSYFENSVRPESGNRPLFAEVALISSHAPWTPILPVLEDWENIGAGEVFLPWEGAGERPEDLWRDVDRVREHYALSVDYALHAAMAYSERYVQDQMLLIVLGDHQPAPLVTGENARRDVPVHIITRNPDLLTPFLEWGFQLGAFPDPARESPRMDAFRGWFLRAFSLGDLPPDLPRTQD